MTLAEAQTMLAAYLQAEAAILSGKEARLDVNGVSRMVRSEDLQQIRAGRQEWERKVAGLQRGGGLGFSLADFSGSM